MLENDRGKGIGIAKTVPARLPFFLPPGNYFTLPLCRADGKKHNWGLLGYSCSHSEHDNSALDGTGIQLRHLTNLM